MSICLTLSSRSVHHMRSIYCPSSLILKCSFHTSTSNHSQKNWRKFPVPNQIGQWEHKKLPKPFLENEFDFPVWRDTLYIRYPGVWFGTKFVYVKEMEPQLVVPDLTDFKLKPYVSYRTPDIHQDQFTAKDLFNSTIADQIIDNFKKGEEMKVEASDEDIEEVRIKVRQAGADIFLENSFYGIQTE